MSADQLELPEALTAIGGSFRRDGAALHVARVIESRDVGGFRWWRARCGALTCTRVSPWESRLSRALIDLGAHASVPARWS